MLVNKDGQFRLFLGQAKDVKQRLFKHQLLSFRTSLSSIRRDTLIESVRSSTSLQSGTEKAHPNAWVKAPQGEDPKEAPLLGLCNSGT